MSSKLSIITINYNDKVGLQKTFDSVFNQTYNDFEYIVIDGNSKDGSVALIEENKDKINYWISEPDKGIYNAMNKGIKAATGEFLLFINSGDCLFNHDTIKSAINQLENSVGIYYGNVMYNSNGVNTMVSALPSTLSFSFFLDFSIPHPASFIKKSLFENYFYYNEELKIVSDWEFFLFTICKKDIKYKHLDLIISNFDDAGISSNEENRKKMLAEKKAVLEKHFPLFKEDIKTLQTINNKKLQQIIYLKSQKVSWRIIKLMVNFLMIFQPKVKTHFSKYYKKV